MKTSVEEVCTNILNNPKPLLFFDTCTILDVIRALHRDAIPDECTSHALSLIKLCVQKDVWLVTAETVFEEYCNNVDTTTDEARQKIKNIHAGVESLAYFYRLTSDAIISPINLFDLELEAAARGIADNLLSSCTLIQREQRYESNAARRVRGNIAPAQKGKSEYKDCEIVECFLDLASKLRNLGYDKNIIFVTANTKDYGGVGSLHSPLDTQFQDVTAGYANSLGHALSLANLL